MDKMHALETVAEKLMVDGHQVSVLITRVIASKVDLIVGEDVAPGDDYYRHPSGDVSEAIIIFGEGTLKDPDVSHDA